MCIKIQPDKKLYVIGNGFDLYHGIKSSYWNFKDYVKSVDNTLYDKLNEVFNTVELWSDFEETLAHIDLDSVIDIASDSLVSYGADDWSDKYHHEYQFYIKEATDIVTVSLRKHFIDWILNIAIDNISSVQLLNLMPDSRYLTFNYTSTLEKVYNISVSAIKYIHNKADNQTSNLILGHSRVPQKVKQSIADDDVRVVEGNQIIDDYFKTTYKNSKEIIIDNKDYFSNLKSILRVYILGHSLAPVDIEYFKEILNNVVKRKTTWIVSYYSREERKRHLSTLRNLGIKRWKIKMRKMKNIK